MTNEEKILNAFPNATARIIENKDFRYIEVEQNDEWIADFNIEWWHSEYKEPKTGHWIYIGNGHNGLNKCSECGGKRKMFDGLEKYCASCGAKMEVEQNG